MGTETVPNQAEAQSFQRLRERIKGVAEPRAPFMDANATALRALVTADWMAQSDAAQKLANATRNGAFDPKCLDELREAARAVLHVLSQLGETADAQRPPLDTTLREEAQRLRQSMADRMTVLLDKNEDASSWLAVARSGTDDGELLYDLRVLGMLFREHRAALQPDESLDADAARAAQIEGDIGAAVLGDRPLEWVEWLARGWTLLANLFERVSRAGRAVLHDVPGMSFPTLASLARTQRLQKAREPGGAARRSQRPGPASRAPKSAHETPTVPVQAMMPPPPAPNEDRITPVGEVFTAATEADLAALEPIRRAPRFNVELQVDIFSESNLYVGFTENLSAAGIFVATHVLRPIGTLIEMSVQFPSRAEPVRLRGEVRWVREYSPLSDACPGMGISFGQLHPDDESLMTEFLKKREPLFFDE